MKLMKCNDCDSMISIDTFVRVCHCGHSMCKRIMGTIRVMVMGPCEVFAVKDSTLSDGKGMIWKVSEPHEQVKRWTKDEVKQFYSED